MAACGAAGWSNQQDQQLSCGRTPQLSALKDPRSRAEGRIQAQADGGAGNVPDRAYQSVGSTPLTAAPGCTTTSTSAWLGQLAAKPHSTNYEYPPRSAAWSGFR